MKIKKKNKTTITLKDKDLSTFKSVIEKIDPDKNSLGFNKDKLSKKEEKFMKKLKNQLFT